MFSTLFCSSLSFFIHRFNNFAQVCQVPDPIFVGGSPSRQCWAACRGHLKDGGNWLPEEKWVGVWVGRGLGLSLNCVRFIILFKRILGKFIFSMFGSARGVYPGSCLKQLSTGFRWQSTFGPLPCELPAYGGQQPSVLLPQYLHENKRDRALWVDEGMDERMFFLKSNMMKQIKFFLDVLSLRFFVDCCSQNRCMSTCSAEILLNSGRTLRHPLHASIWRTARLQSVRFWI